MVSVVKLGNSLLEGPKIPKISDYHSIQFHNDHMKLWRYYGIGEGVVQQYNDLNIQPSVQIVKPFSKTDRYPAIATQTEKKRRKDL